MSPVEFKKRPCHPVEFKGQGPLFGDWSLITGRGRLQNGKGRVGVSFIAMLKGVGAQQVWSIFMW